MITANNAYHQSVANRHTLLSNFFDRHIKREIQYGELSVVINMNELVQEVPCVGLYDTAVIKEVLHHYGYFCKFNETDEYYSLLIVWDESI